MRTRFRPLTRFSRCEDVLSVATNLARFLQARVNLWLEYFGELLSHVVIVNPPRFLGAVFKIMSLMMPDRVLTRFSFASNTPVDIERFISRDAIPIEYGGERRFSPPFTENGCPEPKTHFKRGIFGW